MKSITKAAGMALIALTAAQAVSANEFPYIAPFYCPDSVVQRPDGANPFYRSETCQTVYVLPPQKGTLEFKINTASANDEDCNDLKTMRADHRSLYERFNKLRNAASRDGLTEKEIAVYERQLALIDKNMKELKGSMDKMAGLEGARMDVKLSANLSDEVNRFQYSNQLLFAQGTRFENAPIASSYVSFDSGTKEGADTRPAVIRTSIPGIEVRGVKNAPASDSRIMNGAVSGTVYLGLNAICNIRDQQGAPSIAKTNFSAANMDAFMPANLTYSIPVLSSYSYFASLDYSVVVNDLFKMLETKPDAFTVNSLKDQMVKSMANSKSVWKFTAYELQNRGISDTDLKEIEARERDAVFANWARHIADAMVEMGILKRETPTPIPAPAAGTVAETFYREVCESKSFLGVRYSHNCWNEPYTVVRIQAGLADQTVKRFEELKMKFEESVRYSQPIYRTHTSTFHYVPKN